MRSVRPRGVILLEGADCSGKTTLARHLVSAYGARYLHGRIFRDMWRSHVAMVRLALRWADEGLVVIDRLWLSELIYGQVYRGGPAYDLGARCLDRVLQRVGTVTVLCAPRDQPRQLARHAERARVGEEAFLSVREVVACYADLRYGNVARPGDGYLGQWTRYGDFTQRADVLVYDLDVDGHDLCTFSEGVLRRQRRLRAGQLPAALRSEHQNLVGNLTTATTVVVGERVAPAVLALGPRGPRWPFCWHDGLSAATWLNRALHVEGHDETRAAWTNAVAQDDHLAELLAVGKRVVTLGEVARRRVRQLGMAPTVELEHPQYHRRFHHAQLTDYAQRLRLALRG